MIFKALYGGCIGIMAFLLLFMAPNGRGLVASASPEKVEAQPDGPSGGTTVRRGPRYVWSGYHGK